MGKVYEWGNNPLSDFLLKVILIDDETSFLDKKEDVFENIHYMLGLMNVRDSDLHYLDYKIKEEKKGYYKIIPNNIICAMWFIGALPNNCDAVYEQNIVTYKGKKYKFNKKTKKLKWEKK